mmetsp:Transcript_3850/g.5860  ORF Transcript_3850/g.5860 Transcript_3850/m.5860 type:complete len:132 (+) Transcript_3850:3-398(+)
MGCFESKQSLKKYQETFKHLESKVKTLETWIENLDKQASEELQKQITKKEKVDQLETWRQTSNKRLDEIEEEITEIHQKIQAAKDKQSLPDFDPEDEGHDLEDLELIITAHQDKILSYLEELKQENSQLFS